MAINQELRLTGVGGSDIAQVVGISPFGSAFDVWAKKTGLMKESEVKEHQRRGKYFEKGVVDWYADRTGAQTEWFDSTIVSPDRPWQVVTPDAWIVENGKHVAGVDAKTVNWRNIEHFGDGDGDDIPDYYAVQLHWSMSCCNKPYWDLAAALGLDELRVYRLHRDPQIEAVLLQTAQAFWTENVIPRVAPPIESTDFARAYLRQRFPRNVEVMRPAKDTEQSMLREWLEVNEQFHQLEKRKDDLQVQICDRIGDADGLYFDPHERGKIGRVTWKLGNEVEVAAHTRKATRRFDCRIVKAKLGSRHLLSAPEEKPAVAEAEREAVV